MAVTDMTFNEAVRSAAIAYLLGGGGGGGGSISAVATEDPPTYEEAASEALSMDLSGALRVIGTFEPPVGGATSANQVDGNASLASMDGKLTTLAGHMDGVEPALETTNSLLTTLNGYASDITTPTPIYSPSLRDSANFNRPADTTPYSIGDLVANSTTAGSVSPMVFTVAASSGGRGLIRGVKIDKGGATTATIRAHFWTATPTVTNGDNGVWAPIKAGYLGYIEVVLAAFSDGAVGTGLGELPFDLTAATDVYCLLEARTAYTPTSGSTYTVDVTAWPEA